MSVSAENVSAGPVVVARNLRKAYKNKLALDNTSLQIEPGKIIGLIGPNGAGKTTALKAMLGLIPFEGELKVLGRDPRTERDELMNDVCFIADVAVLPRWIRARKRSSSSPACIRASTAPSASVSSPTPSSSPTSACARCPRA